MMSLPLMLKIIGLSNKIKARKTKAYFRLRLAKKPTMGWIMAANKE